MQRKFIYLTLILLFLTTFISFGQDASKTKNTESDDENEWSNLKPTIRAGLGMQKNFFAEFGLGIYTFKSNGSGSNARGIYGAFEWMPTINRFDNRDVFGWKLGYEMNIKFLALGLDAKYQTRKGINDFVITPKAGISINGVVNLLYGYNISTRNRPFDEVGSHQFSLIFNISPGKISTAR
jgi:hypothetical protein